MGALTNYLQREFERLSAPEWVCQPEVHVLSAEMEQVLGYAPRADVILTHRERPQRLWVEFEVSRADPVANHAKFATAHLFRPQLENDVFVAMVSSHVTRGRRNLAANMVLLMRQAGMSAFQTLLFPKVPPVEIKRLNHLDWHDLEQEHPTVDAELDRALSITRPVLTAQGKRIHFAGDLLEVVMNLRQWNEELATAEGSTLWGRRTISYFVFDPQSGNFAPSKFCAYIPLLDGRAILPGRPLLKRPLMSVALYAALDQHAESFDGSQARSHLVDRLAMDPKTAVQAPEVADAFALWLRLHAASVAVHPSGPVFLLPPSWFA